MLHRVYAGDGYPDDSNAYSTFTTEQLVEWLTEQVKSEQDGDFLRIEIHTYAGEG